MKTINELDKFCNADTGEVDAVGIYTLRESAIEDVKEIQKGSGLNRDLFPESMKGEIAKDK